MDDPPLKDRKEVTGEDEQEDLAPRLKERKEGDPIDFSKDFLHTTNPLLDKPRPEEMIDRTFLLPPLPDGTRHRATIVERVKHMKKELGNQDENIQFRCRYDGDKEDVVCYNDICDFI